MTSTNESTQQLPPAVKTAAVVAHGRVDVHEAVARVRAVGEQAGVTILDDEADPRDADLAVALGGDGTILRTLGRLLGSEVPVIGVNFGRVGFLASIEPDNLERDLVRVFGGEYLVVELPALEVQLNGETHARGERRRRDERDARPDGRARSGRSAARISGRSRATE